MFELFANPFSMMLGALLVASPIIIHLINRMRFKRIRWAAMEFLLKAQQKSQKKLVIQQLLLLLLRILMVLLLGLLLARFLGFDAFSGDDARQATQHIIVIDDTPSMTDFRREDGELKDSFGDAKLLILEKIARPAAQAPTPQVLDVVRLSDPDNHRSFGRLNLTTLEELKAYLDELQPSPKHVHVSAGIAKAQKLFAETRNMKPILHIVSDFRALDWGSEKQQSLGEQFEQLKIAQTGVFLMDVAHPGRTSTANVPNAHDNLAIVDLRPETRIAAHNQTVEFTVYVANYSNTEQKNVKIDVRLNGQNRDEASVVLTTVPPNEISTARFTLTIDDPRSRGDTEEMRRLTPFQLVSAHLPVEATGVAMDNYRYTTIELRKRVPILLVEGRTGSLRKGPRGEIEPTDKTAESFHLFKIFGEMATLKGYYDVQVRTAADLEKLNLRQYLSIYLCGVPKLSEKAVAALEEYTSAGGGVAFFMAPDIKSPDARFYNEVLYKEGKGMFPGSVELKPKNDGVEDDKISPSRMMRRFSGQMQILPRDRYHPALEYLYSDNRRGAAADNVYNSILRFAVIDRYFIFNRLNWRDRGEDVQELMTLARIAPMADFTASVETLMKKVPVDEDKYAPYAESLRKHVQAIRRVGLSNEPLYKLVSELDEMLSDDGDIAAKRPSLRAFWQLPEVVDLTREIRAFMDQVKYGDPLYVAKRFGRGRVVVCSSSAGSSWNEEGPYMAYLPPLMISLNRYLAGSSGDLNLTLTQPFAMSMDESQFQGKVRKVLLSLPEDRSQPGLPAVGPASMVALGTAEMPKKANRYDYEFTEGNAPGIYLLEFTENKPAGADALPSYEYRSLAYNLDTKIEGDLRRAARDDLKRTAQTDNIYSFDDADGLAEKLMDKKSDLSEKPWLYLILLLVLIAEQALAVRLSFHQRAGENAPIGAVIGGTSTRI